MLEVNDNETIEQLQIQVLSNTKAQYMKKSNTLWGHATFKQQQAKMLLEQYMKESNTLAGNANIKQLQSQVLLNTKEQFMKKSNTCAVNATIKGLQNQVL